MDEQSLEPWLRRDIHLLYYRTVTFLNRNCFIWVIHSVDLRRTVSFFRIFSFHTQVLFLSLIRKILRKPN